MVKSIVFDRFMMSEGTKTLILAFTTKPGQPVERTILIWIFLSEGRYTKAFPGLNFRLKTLRILEI